MIIFIANGVVTLIISTLGGKIYVISVALSTKGDCFAHKVEENNV